MEFMWFLYKPMKTRFYTEFVWTYEAYWVCDGNNNACFKQSYKFFTMELDTIFYEFEVIFSFVVLG
jgi:hypothetical protein